MILVNGEPQSTVAVADRGLQYGDGVFETIALRDGQLELWEPHMTRLLQGAQRLSMPAPDPAQLQQEALQLVEQGGEAQGVVKIILTRGEGGRGYLAPQPPTPTRILSLNPWPYSRRQQQSAEQQGVRLHICNSRLGDNPALAGIKHLNRLEQILARQEWSDPEIVEGVVMNQQGEMVEGTMSNLFFVRDGEVITPDLSRCGVEGVMRQQLLQQFERHAIAVSVRPIPLQELVVVDEAFCCNSLIRVWPIRQIGGVTLPAPGVVSRRCMEWLNGGA
jgi:4-amino-4-deoxychorismate lyase